MPRKIAIPNEENEEASEIVPNATNEQSDNDDQAVSVKEIIKEAITSYETEKKNNKKRDYSVSKKRLQSLERARLIKEMNMKNEATDKIEEEKKQNETIMKQKQLEEEKKINDLVELRIKERQQKIETKQEPPKPPQIKRKQYPRKKVEQPKQPKQQSYPQRQMTFFDQFKM
jgi:hypothetical protein